MIVLFIKVETKIGLFCLHSILLNLKNRTKVRNKSRKLVYEEQKLQDFMAPTVSKQNLKIAIFVESYYGN